MNKRTEPALADRDRLVELAVLVNSGALTGEIDEIVDDPGLAV